MHVQSEDSVLKTFIGLEDNDIAECLADPLGAMEKEWLAMEYLNDETRDEQFESGLQEVTR